MYLLFPYNCTPLPRPKYVLKSHCFKNEKLTFAWSKKAHLIRISMNFLLRFCFSFHVLRYVRFPLFEVHKYSILIITILLFIKKVLNKNCHPTPQNNVIWIPTILNVVSYKNIYMKKTPKNSIVHYHSLTKKILPTLSPKQHNIKNP